MRSRSLPPAARSVLCIDSGRASPEGQKGGFFGGLKEKLKRPLKSVRTKFSSNAKDNQTVPDGLTDTLPNAAGPVSFARASTVELTVPDRRSQSPPGHETRPVTDGPPPAGVSPDELPVTVVPAALSRPASRTSTHLSPINDAPRAPHATPVAMTSPAAAEPSSGNSWSQRRFSKEEVVSWVRTVLNIAEKALDGLPVYGPKAAVSAFSEALSHTEVGYR
jgi:hypothetical protein